MRYILLITAIGILLSSCTNQSKEVQQEEEQNQDQQLKSKPSKPSTMNNGRKVRNKSTKEYDLSYFSGQAEIATYKLEKARYEGIHPGEAILIFVAEPFLMEEQVKADHPTNDKSSTVLKMNRIDRFSTGIYDYSMYTSVFTPSEHFAAHYPLKITMGAQDWCGQTFTQVNNNDGFDYSHHSYFESEGDTSIHFEYSMTEDNIFNLVRISPRLLPIGDFEIFPAIHYLRTSHQDIRTYKARGSLTTVKEGKMYVYEIPALKRTVRITISDTNQHRIVRWEENYPTVFDGKIRTSTYELKGVKQIPYWKHNRKEDYGLRKELNLLY